MITAPSNPRPGGQPPPPYTAYAAPAARLLNERTPLLRGARRHYRPPNHHRKHVLYQIAQLGCSAFIFAIFTFSFLLIFRTAFSGPSTPVSPAPSTTLSPAPTTPLSPAPTTTLSPAPTTPLPPYKRHIAIIGAGPAGITTAYQLFLLCSQNHIPVHITIYDQSSHLGGRAVHSVLLPTGEKFDLSTNTFPKRAEHLFQAAKFLGLKTEPFPGVANDLTSLPSASFGVYDGRSWAYTEPHAGDFLSSGRWNTPLLEHYGESVRTVDRLVASTRAEISVLYQPFSSVTDLTFSKFWRETTSTAEAFLADFDVSTAFQRELLNPWTRARFIQNLGTISALGALSAIDNAPLYSIYSPDGMGALWERMARYSNATISLNTRVDSIHKASWGGWELSFNATTVPYDAVVFAAPGSLSSLAIPSPPLEVTYESAHITLFISSSRLSPHPFHGNKNIPDVVLTTPCSWEYTEMSGKTGADGLGQPRFWSLSRVRTILHQGERRWLYKVISATEMTDADLQRLVGLDKKFAWVYRSYAPAFQPLLVPRKMFSRIQLDSNLWYTGGMEELLAGVEFASAGGRNVARLVVEAWKKEGLRPGSERRIPSEYDALRNISAGA